MTAAAIVLPRVSLSIDRVDLSDRDLASIDAVVVQQYLSAPARCEVTFVERPGDEPLAARLAPDARVGLRVGATGAALFDGRIAAVERAYRHGGQTVRVRAYDRLQALRYRQPVRAHDNADLLDIARELTTGIGASVDGPSGLPFWTKFIQYRHSDLDLLVDMASRSGVHFILDGDHLAFFGRDGRGSTTRLTLGANLHELDIEESHIGACRSVRVHGWDPTHVACHDATADEDHFAAPAPGPGAGAGGGGRTLVNETAPDAAQLASRGQALLDISAAGGVVLNGRADGDAALRPGARIELCGAGATFDGEYVVTTARHTIDRRHGHATTFSTEPPETPPRPSGFTVAPGVIRAIDDPEALGRLRVALPTFDGLESDWLCVLAMAAGAGKGVMALPDVGDQVIVLVDVGNPATGVVLGSVYGETGWPDSGIENGVVARYTLLTPGGQRVDLDDAKGRTRISNASGSFVELGPDKVRLHAAADLLIEAPGHAIVIQGQTVDFARA